jgi:hypothetical protein
LAFSTAPSAPLYCSLNGANIYNVSAYGSANVNSLNTSTQGSMVVNCTASTYGLIISYGSGGSFLTINSNSYFQAIRIA